MQKAEWNYMKLHNTSTKVTPKYAAMQHYVHCTVVPSMSSGTANILGFSIFLHHIDFSTHYDCRASIKVSDGNLEAVDALLCQQWQGVKNEGTD